MSRVQAAGPSQADFMAPYNAAVAKKMAAAQNYKLAEEEVKQVEARLRQTVRSMSKKKRPAKKSKKRLFKKAKKAPLKRTGKLKMKEKAKKKRQPAKRRLSMWSPTGGF